MSGRSTHHATSFIERVYDTPPAVAYDAFTHPHRKDRWFTKSNNWPIAEYGHDFRVGGVERGRFGPDGTTIILNDTVYRDIVPRERIVCAYTMTVGDKPISCLLATTEFFAESDRTRLRYTEQGAFLGGLYQAADRKAGCEALFDSPSEEIARGAD